MGSKGQGSTRMEIDPHFNVRDLKKQQIQHTENYFRDLQIMNFEISVYHDYFREIPFRKLKQLLDETKVDLNHQEILVSCCGSGMDIHYLKKFYDAKYFATDISQNAVQTTVNSFTDVKGQAEDLESLSFKDNTFDYSFVAAALHHLPRPLVGLYELYRVAKKGVIVIEPSDSLLTRLATRLRLATEIEESGNYVYRIHPWDIKRITRSLFCDFDYVRFFATHRIAKNNLEFAVLKFLNGMANLALPSQGNYIVFHMKKAAP